MERKIEGRVAGILAGAPPLTGESAKAATVKKSAPTLYFIIADKLFKGVLSLLLAFGFYRMAGLDLSVLFDHWVVWMHLDPENRFLTDVGNLIDEITPANMRWMATGTLLYSALSLVEGIGLAFRAPWANWLAIAESAFFIPIEIFELLHRRVPGNPRHAIWNHRELGLALVLAGNVLIVWYLYANRKRLFSPGGS